MKKTSIEQKIILGYWLAFFVLVVIAVFAFQNSNELENSNYAVAHTYEVLNALEGINTLCTEMQSATRGYIISPRPSFRQTVFAGETLLMAGILESRMLVKDNKEQRVKMEELEAKINQFTTILHTMISIRDIQGEDHAKKYFNVSESPRIMMEIKQMIRIMSDSENGLLRNRQAMRDELIASYNWLYISLLSSVFIVMIILYSNIIKTVKNSASR
jgi:CHASE3 domain sensor protein